jgi:hypothetical protein
MTEQEPGSDRDPFVDQETAAAAAEAARIGGRPPRGDRPDPALAPVYQAGGGEAEGFEQAEERLIDNAEHGDDLTPDPYNDAFAGEVESDRATAEYGEPDRERSSETEDEDEGIS